MEPGHREEYIAYLLKHERWGEAAAELATCVNDDTFRSLEGKSKHTLWLELCDIITKHPEEVRHLNIDAIIRGGIRKFTNEARACTTLICMPFSHAFADMPARHHGPQHLTPSPPTGPSGIAPLLHPPAAVLELCVTPPMPAQRIPCATISTPQRWRVARSGRTHKDNRHVSQRH